jgi:hypothetical protein
MAERAFPNGIFFKAIKFKKSGRLRRMGGEEHLPTLYQQLFGKTFRKIFSKAIKK